MKILSDTILEQMKKDRVIRFTQDGLVLNIIVWEGDRFAGTSISKRELITAANFGYVDRILAEGLEAAGRKLDGDVTFKKPEVVDESNRV